MEHQKYPVNALEKEIASLKMVEKNLRIVNENNVSIFNYSSLHHSLPGPSDQKLSHWLLCSVFFRLTFYFNIKKEPFPLFQLQLLESKENTIRMLNDLLSKKDGELAQERKINQNLNQLVGILLRKEETNAVSGAEHTLEVMEKPIEGSVTDELLSNVEFGAVPKQQVASEELLASKAEEITGFLPIPPKEKSQPSAFVPISKVDLDHEF